VVGAKQSWKMLVASSQRILQVIVVYFVRISWALLVKHFSYEVGKLVLEKTDDPLKKLWQ
jgi:hypothetical protein